jgi:hypothetical protein
MSSSHNYALVNMFMVVSHRAVIARTNFSRFKLHCCRPQITLLEVLPEFLRLPLFNALAGHMDVNSDVSIGDYRVPRRDYSLLTAVRNEE